VCWVGSHAADGGCEIGYCSHELVVGQEGGVRDVFVLELDGVAQSFAVG
jgi:hypothetical protein